MVILALRKNDTRLTARAIQWWTNSDYSHCELVVGSVSYSSSAMDGGVRAKVINMDADKWDMIELPWADPDKVVSHFQATRKHKYGWVGIVLSQVFNTGRGKARTQFCSQWCAEALGLPNSSSYSPASLSALVAWITAQNPLSSH